MGNGQIIGLILCKPKKMSVRGGLGTEKEESSEDFYEYHGQGVDKQNRGNYGAKQLKRKVDK